MDQRLLDLHPLSSPLTPSPPHSLTHLLTPLPLTPSPLISQERLLLSLEQELVRAHQRAAKNYRPPVSVCAVLLERLLPHSLPADTLSAPALTADNAESQVYVYMYTCTVYWRVFTGQTWQNIFSGINLKWMTVFTCVKIMGITFLWSKIFAD